MDDYSAPKRNKKLLEALAKDKGDRIAVLNAELADLEETLPGRLQIREDLERQVVGFKEEKKALESDIYSSRKKLDAVKADLVRLTDTCDALGREESNLRQNIRDLEDKRLERDSLARDIQRMHLEETELAQSLRHKELELRSITVRIGPMQEREDQVRQREAEIFRQENALLEEGKITARRLIELKESIAKNDEQIAYIDRGGKTMGYYIRGVQKLLDERKIDLNFIELLNEIK